MHTALDVVVHTEEAYWPVVHGLQGVHVAELTVVEYVLLALPGSATCEEISTHYSNEYSLI